MKLNSKEIFQTFILAIGVFLFVLDLFILNVSLPRIQDALHITNADGQWIIILYIMGYASLLINAGKAGERFGRKKLYVLGMLGFTLSSLICGMAINMFTLLAGRLMQGISAGLMVPQGIALLTLSFPDLHKRTRALGIYGSVAGIASVLGQLLGGILPDQKWLEEGWRLIFLVNIPIGALAIFATLIFIAKDAAIPTIKLGYKAMVQLFLLLVLLLFPLVVGPELHWPLGLMLLFVLALILLFRFFKTQKKLFQQNLQPMLNFELFKNRSFTLGLGIALAYYMVQDSYFIINSNYLQMVRNFSSTATGIAFVYQGIGYVLASIIAGSLIQKYGKVVLLSGLAIMLSTLLLHLFIMDAYPVPVEYLHGLFFGYGLGCGTVLPALMTLALRSLDPSLIGVGSAVYLTVQQIAICLGVVFVVGSYYHGEESVFWGFSLLSAAYAQAIVFMMFLLTLVIYGILRFYSAKK